MAFREIVIILDVLNAITSVGSKIAHKYMCRSFLIFSLLYCNFLQLNIIRGRLYFINPSPNSTVVANIYINNIFHFVIGPMYSAKARTALQNSVITHEPPDCFEIVNISS